MKKHHPALLLNETESTTESETEAGNKDNEKEEQPEPPEAPETEPSDQRKRKGNTEETDIPSKIRKTVLIQKKIKKFATSKRKTYMKSSRKWKFLNFKLFRMLMKDYQPFSIVEDAGFREYSNALDPKYILPSRAHLTRTVLPKVYEIAMKKLNNELNTVTYV